MLSPRRIHPRHPAIHASERARRPPRRWAAALVILGTVTLSSACNLTLPAVAGLGRPPAPTGASAWAGTGVAFVRWTPVAAQGATVTRYSVTPIVAGVAQPARSVVTATGSATVTGLAQGTVAAFRIAAVDALGAGRSVETNRVSIGHDPLSSKSSWLDVVNYVRQSSGEGRVTANASWVAGLQAHDRYLSGTPTSQRLGGYASAHTENPASSYYSVSGEAAGASADLMSGATGSALANLNAWLASPFHAIGIIRPALRSSAYASGPGAAGLDVIRGVDRSAPRSTRTVLLPGPGAITTNRAYTGAELPNPLQSCPGFTSGGLPIVALLPTTPPATVTASLRQPDGTVVSGRDLCVITARTFVSTDKVYGPAGRSVLADSNAVILIPRHALQLGRQTVTLSPAGRSPITWSFSVAAA